MNKLFLALLSASITSVAICNDAVAEGDKEKVAVVEAAVAKRCSGCPCTTPTADKSAPASSCAKATADTECPCEEAGKVCACPQMAEAAPADTQAAQN
ncbi:MAG: hypothetical protein ACHQVS_05355 [Candidatus Babeliales bacterium]